MCRSEELLIHHMLLVLTDLIIKKNLFVVSSGGLVHRHRGAYVTELRSCIARRSENGAGKSELVENVKAIKHNAGAKNRCGHPSMKKRRKRQEPRSTGLNTNRQNWNRHCHLRFQTQRFEENGSSIPLLSCINCPSWRFVQLPNLAFLHLVALLRKNA